MDVLIGACIVLAFGLVFLVPFAACALIKYLSIAP
jgi:hypothetical protein